MTEIIQSKMINLNLHMYLGFFYKGAPICADLPLHVIVLHWASLRRQQERLQLL